MDLYDPSSSIILDATLEDVQLSSFASKWIMTMQFSGTKVDPFTVQAEHNFETYFSGDAACEASAGAFPRAVAMLLNKLYRSKQFEQIVGK